MLKNANYTLYLSRIDLLACVLLCRFYRLTYKRKIVKNKRSPENYNRLPAQTDEVQTKRQTFEVQRCIMFFMLFCIPLFHSILVLAGCNICTKSITHKRSALYSKQYTQHVYEPTKPKFCFWLFSCYSQGIHNFFKLSPLAYLARLYLSAHFGHPPFCYLKQMRLKQRKTIVLNPKVKI